MPAKGIRGGMCVENELCTKTRGTDEKYSTSKQSTLVPAKGIRGGMCVENELCTKTRGTDGKYFKS